jgi:hypothetical protein
LKGNNFVVIELLSSHFCRRGAVSPADKSAALLLTVADTLQMTALSDLSAASVNMHIVSFCFTILFTLFSLLSAPVLPCSYNSVLREAISMRCNKMAATSPSF